MYSSRMRTGRSLTVCRSLLPGGGGGGVCFGVVCSRGGWGVSAARGGGGGGSIPACTEADPPCEQNDKQMQKYYLGHNFVAAGN